jgi:hypothetical protein
MNTQENDSPTPTPNGNPPHPDHITALGIAFAEVLSVGQSDEEIFKTNGFLWFAREVAEAAGEALPEGLTKSFTGVCDSADDIPTPEFTLRVFGTGLQTLAGFSPDTMAPKHLLLIAEGKAPGIRIPSKVDAIRAALAAGVLLTRLFQLGKLQMTGIHEKHKPLVLAGFIRKLFVAASDPDAHFAELLACSCAIGNLPPTVGYDVIRRSLAESLIASLGEKAPAPEAPTPKAPAPEGVRNRNPFHGNN